MKIEAKIATIEEIINDKMQNEWVLPKFQRDSTWNNEQVQDLKLSIEEDSPIGALTILSDKGNDLIIDGQQRLTSIIKLSEEKKWFNKYKNYSVPYIEWEKKNKNEDIVKHFVNMNTHGTSLDAEDIVLSYFSEKHIKTPTWFKEHKIFDQLYKDKNDKIAFIDYNTIKQISYIECLWYMKQKLSSFKNHDKNLIAAITKKSTNSKIKNQIIWLKRILAILSATKPKDMDFQNENFENYSKNLKQQLIKIFETNESFNLFIEKLNYLFDNFTNKFDWIWEIPFNQSSRDNKNTKNISTAKDYITIYMLDFIYKNKKMFYKKEKFVNFQKATQKYKVKHLDLIHFMLKSPISAGGLKKWYSYILKKNSELFFNKNEKNIEDISSSILNVSHEGKTFKNTQRVIILWLLSDIKLQKTGNKSHWYTADHIIPYSRVDNNATHILNCQLLTHAENGHKSNEIDAKYLGWGPMEKINSKTKGYENVVKIIKSFNKKAKKIPQVEYEEFLAARHNQLKPIIIKKIKSKSA